MGFKSIKFPMVMVPYIGQTALITKAIGKTAKNQGLENRFMQTVMFLKGNGSMT